MVDPDDNAGSRGVILVFVYPEIRMELPLLGRLFGDLGVDVAC